MPSRERISLPGGDFELLTEGAKGAPLALCLHGFPDHAPSFTPLLSALAGAGYRAVAPWLRGYAPSTLDGPFDPGRLADDARELADALSPDRPIALIGHDWGAVITYEAAARWPDRIASAVTMAVPHPAGFFSALPQHPAQIRRSWYIFLFQLPLLPERAVAHNDHALIDRLWRDWSPGYSPPPSDMRALKDCLARSMPAPINYYRAFLRPVKRAIQRAREAASPDRRIKVPLLCLMGEQDGCIGASLGRDDARFFAGRYQRDEVRGVGHFMQLEAPAEIARRVLDWLPQCGERTYLR
jgi:pimeloyl-ACP methyl ester carboxylesterase